MLLQPLLSFEALAGHPAWLPGWAVPEKMDSGWGWGAEAVGAPWSCGWTASGSTQGPGSSANALEGEAVCACVSRPWPHHRQVRLTPQPCPHCSEEPRRRGCKTRKQRLPRWVGSMLDLYPASEGQRSCLVTGGWTWRPGSGGFGSPMGTPSPTGRWRYDSLLPTSSAISLPLAGEAQCLSDAQEGGAPHGGRGHSGGPFDFLAGEP